MTHEVDAYCDAQVGNTKDWIEQDDSLLLMEQERDFYEMEAKREATLKQQGAIEVLENLRTTLSQLCLRDDVRGQYFFGLHDALEIVKSNLGTMKGGIA